MNALRTAAITFVILAGCTGTVLAAAYLPPVLAVFAAVVTVTALIGVGEWLKPGGETGGNFGGDSGGNIESATVKLRAVGR